MWLEVHQLDHPALNLPLSADKPDKKAKWKPSSVGIVYVQCRQPQKRDALV